MPLVESSPESSPSGKHVDLLTEDNGSPTQVTEPTSEEVIDSQVNPVGRRIRLPLILFAVTCVSVFFSGALQWIPQEYAYGRAGLWHKLPQKYVNASPVMSHQRIQEYQAFWLSGRGMLWRLTVVKHWRDGLTFMIALLSILMFHEMGHFLMTLRYRIPASLPYFLPLPVTPIGTMGAVIGMDGKEANRKEIFDIGIAGPLAGLVVAIPVMWLGVRQLNLTPEPSGPFAVELPLVLRWIVGRMALPGYDGHGFISHAHLNPLFMAGWVGLLITGLNMLPVGQLDGGHVLYTLFGRHAHLLARIFLVLIVAYVTYADLWNRWALMLGLVLLMGPDHPPTRDDKVPIGIGRTILGILSLAIPFLCFPPSILIET